MMKKCNWLCLMALLLTGMFLSGCRSDTYYQDQAVQKARKYILDELEDMPLMEREFIKFNNPFMLISQLTGGYRTGMAQVCICWMVPDNPELYMVYGVSGMRMLDWSPKRIIRKNFTVPDKGFLQASHAASEYILQTLFGLLSVESVNHIRFSMPGLWKSKFPLDSNPDMDWTPEKLSAAEKLPRYVLAWKITDNGEDFYVVRGGTARDDKLTGFTPYTCGIYNAAEFKANLADPKALVEPFGGFENMQSPLFPDFMK